MIFVCHRPLLSHRSNGVAFTFNLRFPGQYFDAETGLNYNDFRDYDPRTGRYVESDPVGLRGGLGTYSYVGNSPLQYMDVFGEAAMTTCQGDGGMTCAEANAEALRAMGIRAGQAAETAAAADAATSDAGTDAIPGDPNGDHCCESYTNIYQANDNKHGPVARPGPRGTISRLPTNGQAALDASVPAGKGRIGYDSTTGELVMFRLHFIDERNCIKYWHGYVVTVGNLTPEQWRAGRDAGFPNWPRKPK